MIVTYLILSTNKSGVEGHSILVRSSPSLKSFPNTRGSARGLYRSSTMQL